MHNFPFTELVLPGLPIDVVDLVVPSPARLALLLQLDLRLAQDDMPIKGSTRMLIRRDTVAGQWFQVMASLHCLFANYEVNPPSPPMVWFCEVSSSSSLVRP